MSTSMKTKISPCTSDGQEKRHLMKNDNGPYWMIFENTDSFENILYIL